MPCDHKFKSYLNLERIDFVPATLIVGTFDPEWPGGNTAEWFYGRTASNYFWDVLPRLYGQQSLIDATPVEWKQFCHDNQIAITDLISSIDDANADDPKHRAVFAGFSDRGIHYNFDDFTFVNIVGILRNHPSIKNVYFTKGITEVFWRHLWNPVAHYCNHNNLRERKLLPPTGKSLYQQTAHNAEHPDDIILLPEDYILRRWQKDWHFHDTLS